MDEPNNCYEMSIELLLADLALPNKSIQVSIPFELVSSALVAVGLEKNHADGILKHLSLVEAYPNFSIDTLSESIENYLKTCTILSKLEKENVVKHFNAYLM